MKRLVAAAVALVVVVGGVLWWRRSASTGAAEAGRLVAASYGDLAVRVTASGSVQSARAITLVAEAAGTLVELDARAGQAVKAGQLLARIDDRGAAAQRVAQAQAALSQARLQLQQLQDPRSFVTDTAVTNARLAVQQAQAGLAQAQAAQRAAEAALRARQNALEAAQAAMEVTAPGAGTVEYVAVTPGQSLNAGQTLAAVVAPGSAVLVQAQIPQTGYAGSVGDPASVVVNAVNQTFNGTVTAVQNGNPTTLPSSTASSPTRISPMPFAPVVPPSGGGSVTVTVTLPPEAASAGLKDGMTALVTINSPSGQSAQGTGVVQYQNDWTLTAAPTAQGANVSDVLVRPGDAVTAGQVLIRLDSQALETNLTQARDAVAAAQAQADQAEAAVRQAEAQLATAQAHLDQVEHPEAGLPQQVQAGQAAVSAAQAALEAAQRAAAQLEVRSPIDGVVARTLLVAGDPVAPGTPIAAVVDPNGLQAVVQVPEQQVGLVSPGAQATVRADALGGRTFAGRVAEVSPVGQNAGGGAAYDVTIDIPGSQGLQPGMAVQATLDVPPVRHVLLVPVEAVSSSGGSTTVLVASGGTFDVRKVTTGLSDGRQIAIVDGLAPGEKVFVPAAP